MSALASIIVGIGGIVHSLLTIYIWVIIIAALLSWVRPDPYNPIVQFLTRITTPAYQLVRRMMPTTFNGIDLAPLIIIIGLQVIDISNPAFPDFLALHGIPGHYRHDAPPQVAQRVVDSHPGAPSLLGEPVEQDSRAWRPPARGEVGVDGPEQNEQPEDPGQAEAYIGDSPTDGPDQHDAFGPVAIAQEAVDKLPRRVDQREDRGHHAKVLAAIAELVLDSLGGRAEVVFAEVVEQVQDRHAEEGLHSQPMESCALQDLTPISITHDTFLPPPPAAEKCGVGSMLTN